MKPPVFEQTLSKAINAYLDKQRNGRFATTAVWLKGSLLLVLCFLLYGLMVFGDFEKLVRLGLVVLWGLVSLLIVFNVGHDAVHGALSHKGWLNKIFGYSFNLVGANAYSWQLKHNEAHHMFTNINGKDHDIEMDPFLRVSPHQPHRWYYRWQHWYWPVVYAMLSFLIIFVVDVLIFFQERKLDERLLQPFKEWVILVLTKLFYLWYIFWVPIYYAGFTGAEVLLAFFLYHAINGLIIGLVFQPSHYFIESIFYHQDYKNTGKWHSHQLNSTLDISPENTFLSQVLGGLNANVSHHLYPKICHVHYPHLSSIVSEEAQRHDMPYHRKNYLSAVVSHIALLKKYSKSDQ